MTNETLNSIVVVPTPEDILYLREKLRQANHEFADLEKRILFVIKHNGVVSGCIAARLVWQVEPLYLTPEFQRDAGPMTIRRAVFKLCRTICNWLGGPENKTGIRWTFAYIEGKKEMQQYVQDNGFVPVYRKGKMFARNF